jgi:hypothetical protein
MIRTKAVQALHRRDAEKWSVVVGFLGKIGFVKAYPAKVFAEAEAKRLRLQYPDTRAEFWVSKATIRGMMRWATVEPQLSRDGYAIQIFGASTKTLADYRVMRAVRSAIRSELAQTRRDPALAFLPYSVRDLIEHISAQFQPGMSWANHGAEWQIDHIHPRAAFDMRDPDQLAKCWALGNLRPLWAAENSAKGTADKTLAV